MPSPFPGMNPYLETTTRWRNVHARLIVAIANTLSPQILPKYQSIINKHEQRFIEVRDTENQEVVTVIEVLSPTNKKSNDRKQYIKKRERLLESKVNLVELDFLHAGKAMPMLNSDIKSHYRILVSTLQLRPQALLYPFNLTQPLPVIAIPLREEDKPPKVDFQALLDQVYERSGYEFSIDYTQPPTPTWNEPELSWISQKINQD